MRPFDHPGKKNNKNIVPESRAFYKRRGFQPEPDREGQTTGDLLVSNAATILIVGDNNSVLQVTQTLAQRMGYQTLKAQAGQEALGLVRSFGGDIHLTLLDISMPGRYSRYERLTGKTTVNMLP
ncbi:MAG: hypothetical protein JXA89_16725 [Anaerolineae bacterium]|nr:hypothetical protein [Anaerolineae bacterium]